MHRYLPLLFHRKIPIILAVLTGGWCADCALAGDGRHQEPCTFACHAAPAGRIAAINWGHLISVAH